VRGGSAYADLRLCFCASVRAGTAGVILRMFSAMRTPVSTRVWRFVRAGGASPDPTNVVRRAQSFAVAASESGTVTLVCVRDERGMAGYLVTSDGSSADQAALHLAQTVAARAKPVAALPGLDGVGSVGWLRAQPTSVASPDVQAGADPSEVSRRLAVAMRPGQWVAIVARPASRTERKRVLRWYAHRLGTANPVHHITVPHRRLTRYHAPSAGTGLRKRALTSRGSGATRPTSWAAVPLDPGGGLPTRPAGVRAWDGGNRARPRG